MTLEIEGSSRRLPTLVQLCQRVAAANVDSISSLGDELPYGLVKPILERCDANQLARFELSSPHLQEDTQAIWKHLCYSVFSLIIHKWIGEKGEPECWRNCYYDLQKVETARLEQASSKLRHQRNNEEERRKEREVKLTDRVPPPKKPRWGASSQPKTLFQKTRSEASKLQKSMYHTRMIPPMVNGKTFRVLPGPPDLSVGTASSTSRVTVNTVLQRKPETKVSASPLLRMSQEAPPISTPPNRSASEGSPAPKTTPKKPPSELNPSLQSQTRPPPLTAKRDPMACLFVPKHRAHSQRP